MSKEKAMVIDDMKFTIDYKTCGMTEEEADNLCEILEGLEKGAE